MMKGSFLAKGSWILALLVMTGYCTADIYKWQDTNGKWQFSDTPPKGTSVDSLELADPNVVPSVEVRPPEVNKNEVSRRGKVVMYSTSWCGYCAKARRYFKQNNIAFTELDIEKSARAKHVFKSKYGGGGVPLLVYSGKTMRGFSEPRFDAFYGRRN